MSDADPRSPLIGVLEAARQQGFLGPGPVGPHVAHARGFAAALVAAQPHAPTIRAHLNGAEVLDLGSGAGVPGLPLAVEHNRMQLVLLDAGRRRCAWLRTAVATLGLEHRVRVVEGRAEHAARESGLRGRFDVVVARSFAAPAPTAELGGAFLRVGGALVVSEPPVAAARGLDRWPTEPLAGLGLVLVGRYGLDEGTFAVIVRTAVVEERQPRRLGIPTKRPLW